MAYKDTGKLSRIDELCGEDDQLKSIYRTAMVNVLQNPLLTLAKKAADIEVAMEKQRRIDSSEGVELSREMIQAAKISLEAAKIRIKAEELKNKSRSAKREVMSEQQFSDEDVIDVDFEELD